MYSKSVATIATLLLNIALCAQAGVGCDIQLIGSVHDDATGEPLAYATVYIEETSEAVFTDSLGRYTFEGLCSRGYHIVFTHIGCEPLQVFVRLEQDTTMRTTLRHSITVIGGVTVTDDLILGSTTASDVINEVQIEDNAGELLADQLTDLAGVSALRTGSGIAKPIVHGLYGNRITVLNNGIPQSGQQWGNDHSPEIDPLAADRIRVIKGVDALGYMGSSLGSMVIVEPSAVDRNEPHLHGKAMYFYHHNGRGHGTHLELQQAPSTFRWKANATYRRVGDRRTPDYYLNNTGTQEINGALQLEKDWSKRLFTSFYASTFNADIGVLRGSHIGNLTDLRQALERDVPFFTEPDFSYAIDAPRQQVHHHMGKAYGRYFLNDSTWVELTAAIQLNDRREYDVRRGDRDSIPALSLLQYTTLLEAKYNRDYTSGAAVRMGVQWQFVDNENDPGTGILPLIPDYETNEVGAFATYSRPLGKSVLEAGLRYELVHQRAVTISATLPRRLIKYDELYHNGQVALGWRYRLYKQVQLSANTGLVTRNPAINELYSAGLHQGVSGIEEGDPDLNSELSWKTTFGVQATVNSTLTFEALAYYQRITDYIYLAPQDEFRLTIRGAFPVFVYEQTDARIQGLDLTACWYPTESVRILSTFSYIDGRDLSESLALVFIPANSLRTRVSYELVPRVSWGRLQLDNPVLSLESEWVDRQRDLLPEQDFAPPPSGYHLLHARLATDIQVSQTRLRAYVRVDNLLDTSYRDYLNRQRYFADELGRNVALGVTVEF